LHYGTKPDEYAKEYKREKQNGHLPCDAPCEHRTVPCSCDWNVGGGTKRDSFIKTNNFLFGIDPKKHGFKTYYYGVGTLRK
jgi:hypothetical protein